MADITQVQDANGKTFSFDISKITDINGDTEPNSTVQDSMRAKLAFAHDTTYVNAKGEEIDTTKLISDLKSGNTKIAAVDVDFEATHSGKNHNYCIYYSDSMEKDAESFTNPFSKPLLKNHDSYCEPIGRIRKAVHSDSSLTDERTAIKVTARVTDDDAMVKFIDGRYRTVSIGGSMNTVTCNICGKTILKDGKFKFCGHWKGETYKDQVCYWGARDIEYNELSVVNNPADDFAQVMRVTVLTDEDIKKSGTNDSKEDNKMDGVENTKDEMRQKVFDFIDSLLKEAPSSPEAGDQQQETPAAGTTDVPETQATDAVNQATPEVNEDAPKEEAKKGKKGAKDSEEEDDLQRVSDELTSTKEELQKVNDELAEAKSQLEAKDKEIEELNGKISDSETNSETMKSQMIEIAKQNKSLVSDAIIAKELASGKIKAEDSDSRMEELSAMSMKELGDALAALNTVPTQRKTASVASPVLANDSNSNSHKADADIQGSQTEKPKTVNDFASSIINKLPV